MRLSLLISSLPNTRTGQDNIPATALLELSFSCGTAATILPVAARLGFIPALACREANLALYSASRVLLKVVDLDCKSSDRTEGNRISESTDFATQDRICDRMTSRENEEKVRMIMESVLRGHCDVSCGSLDDGKR
jgi:hypothetical protein